MLGPKGRLSQCLGIITAGVSKVRPPGQIRPASSVDPACSGSSVLTSGVCAPTKRTKRWAIVFMLSGFSRTLIVDDDWLAYSRWRWMAPLHLTCSVTSHLTLVLFVWWSSEKNSIKLKIGGIDLKMTLNKILKVPMFPSCAFANMMSWWLWGSRQTFHWLQLLLI